MRLVDTSNVPCDILLLMDVNKWIIETFSGAEPYT